VAVVELTVIHLWSLVSVATVVAVTALRRSVTVELLVALEWLTEVAAVAAVTQVHPLEKVREETVVRA
jgi:hypothetical protein